MDSAQVDIAASLKRIAVSLERIDDTLQRVTHPHILVPFLAEVATLMRNHPVFKDEI